MHHDIGLRLLTRWAFSRQLFSRTCREERNRQLKRSSWCIGIDPTCDHRRLEGREPPGLNSEANRRANGLVGIRSRRALHRSHGHRCPVPRAALRRTAAPAPQCRTWRRRKCIGNFSICEPILSFTTHKHSLITVQHPTNARQMRGGAAGGGIQRTGQIEPVVVREPRALGESGCLGEPPEWMGHLQFVPTPLRKAISAFLDPASNEPPRRKRGRRKRETLEGGR